jgi:hypothetical protein
LEELDGITGGKLEEEIQRTPTYEDYSQSSEYDVDKVVDENSKSESESESESEDEDEGSIKCDDH